MDGREAANSERMRSPPPHNTAKRLAQTLLTANNSPAFKNTRPQTCPTPRNAPVTWGLCFGKGGKGCPSCFALSALAESLPAWCGGAGEDGENAMLRELWRGKWGAPGEAGQGSVLLAMAGNTADSHQSIGGGGQGAIIAASCMRDLDDSVVMV